MNDSNTSEEVRFALDNIKTWLAARSTLGPADAITIAAPEILRSIGFADLTLKRFRSETQSEVICSYDDSPQAKPKSWTELGHLVNWSMDLGTLMRTNATNFAILELLRGGDECHISLANFHVSEAIGIIESATNFEVALDIHHPDTRNQNYGADCVLIEDSTTLTDIVRQIFGRLFSKCVVNLVVKSNQFCSAMLIAYLVDMMLQCGATSNEVKCFTLDKRESLDNEKLSKCSPPTKASKLSVVATVFKQTDTFAAAQGIIESYFREGFPNLIIMVDESAYDRFIRDWQRYYSFAINIGARLDPRTSVVDSLNSRLQVNLQAIDIKSSHKMAGEVINVLKFRSLTELVSLLGNLRKIPYMTVWNDDVLLAREFCVAKMNQCSDFWLNHVPRSIASRKFPEDMMGFYSNVVAEDMAYVYNLVMGQFSDEAEQLKKIHSAFAKKDSRLRMTLILQAYISLVTKCKSLKNGSSVGESIARLKKFQHGLHRFSCLQREKDSLIEIVTKAVGMAVILVRDESSIKSKAVLVEMIFKNLLLGNAVLLACPANCLGTKFSFENDHVIPFKMVHESLPDMSKLSLDETATSYLEQTETTMSKKLCPKNTYAVEILPDMTSEACDAITVSLGSRRKCVWYPGNEQANYWVNEWN